MTFNPNSQFLMPQKGFILVRGPTVRLETGRWQMASHFISSVFKSTPQAIQPVVRQPPMIKRSLWKTTCHMGWQYPCILEMQGHTASTTAFFACRHCGFISRKML